MKQEQLYQPGTYVSIPKLLASVPSKYLPATAKLIWAAIAGHLGKNDEAWPGQTLIGQETGLSTKRVNEDIQRLVDHGWLTKRRTQSTIRYTLCLPAEPGYVEIDNSRFRQVPFVEIDKSGCVDIDQSGYVDIDKQTTQGNYPSNYSRNEESASPPRDGFAAANLSSQPTDGSTDRQVELLQPNGSESMPSARQVNAEAPTAGAKSAPLKRSVGNKVPTGKLAPLSDSDRQVICASFDALRGYYLFGRQTIGRPASDWLSMGLTPAQTNWAPTATVAADFARPVEDASFPAWAAWAACQLWRARQSVGLPQLMPDVGRLIGAIKPLRARLTALQLADVIETIGGRWAELRSTLSWMNDLSPIEAVLQNTRVIEAALTLAAKPGRPAAGNFPVGTNLWTGKPSYAGAF